MMEMRLVVAAIDVRRLVVESWRKGDRDKATHWSKSQALGEDGANVVRES
jgi:hypothetical protein